MDLPLAITQLELKLKNFPGIADNYLLQSFKDDEFEITTEDVSIINNNQNTETFSTGMNETRSSKKFSPVTQRSNTSASSEQISTPSSETTLVKGTEYTFYDDNGNKFIIDNADFEEEEEELTEIFNPNSALVSNYPNSKIDSYNESFHFIPIPMGASSDNCTDEDDDKENVITSTSNTNPFLPNAMDAPSDNLTAEDEDEENVVAPIPNTYPFIPIATDAPSDNLTDEDEDEENMKMIIKKMVPFLPQIQIIFYQLKPLQSDKGTHEDDNKENGVTSTPNTNPFLPIETDAPFDNRTDEDEENVVASTPNINHLLTIATDASSNNRTDEEEDKEIVVASFTNTNQLLRITTDAPSANRTDEDEDEANVVASSPKKNAFKKMKSFFKKARKDCRNCFSYKRFQ
ncbi:hypothetical protein TNCT_610191 [Trichonephila clavata]|uniref:Uncharacterized protein n=1 Tax=Trichonephila clavata TaxID=2740835 RepID=A0A8X6LQI9_TRICU|nr:hypothetical protein TNCT_610191 [Trichonephila clavata]